MKIFFCQILYFLEQFHWKSFHSDSGLNIQSGTKLLKDTPKAISYYTAWKSLNYWKTLLMSLKIFKIHYKLGHSKKNIFQNKSLITS